MKVKWNDDIPYIFLMKFGTDHSSRTLDALGAIKRLRFKEVSIDDIELHDPIYKVFIPRLQFHATRVKNKKSIGTLLCRKMDNGKWMPKDGNHRLYTLIAHGVKTFRIAYDPENKV